MQKITTGFQLKIINNQKLGLNNGNENKFPGKDVDVSDLADKFPLVAKKVKIIGQF